jgi:cytoskeletal protein CcmA (bactofilin family)
LKPFLRFSFLFFTAWVLGEEPASERTVIAEEYWYAGDEVSLDVEAKADVFLFGRDAVETDGVFHQDLWAAGRRVEFRGVAHDDVRLAAGEFLTVDGEMTGGTLRAVSARNLLVNTNAVIRGTAHLTATRNLTVNGEFTGDVSATGASIIFAAQVDGDLTLLGNSITVMPGSRVTGTLFYRGDRAPHLPHGVLDTEPVALPEAEGGEGLLGQFFWMLRVIQVFSAFVIGLLMVRFLPRFTGNCVETVLKMQPQCMFLGLVTTLILGGMSYLLMVSVLGLGVGIFLLMILGLLFYSGKIVLALALGALVVKHREPLTFFRLSLGLLVGLVLLYSVFSLPWIGTTLWMIASCWGMGAMVQGIRNSQRVLKLEIPPHLRED